MNPFWNAFVIVIVVTSIAGCLWLLLANRKGEPGAATTGHTWDDDLAEYNNPLPRWWFNLFLLTVVFGVGYLVFYPGLGNVAGRLGWTARSEMKTQLEVITAQRAAQFTRFGGMSVEALSHEPAARQMGRSIFVSNCAGCHGTDAQGAVGFPNLTDRDWLYGGAPDTILATIKGGRDAAMPSFFSALSPEQVQALVDFIPFWSDPKLEPGVREAGMKVFSGICAACHGADGKGNVAIGAPNLTDDVWLFGGTRARVRETILYGRSSHMPSHEALLTADEQRVVAGYVASLSQPPAAEVPVQAHQRTAANP